MKVSNGHEVDAKQPALPRDAPQSSELASVAAATLSLVNNIRYSHVMSR